MIRFEHVSVIFQEKKKEDFTAVSDADFSIEEGEIFGILGSSGAGKSTLLRTINGLQKVTAGHVLVDGQDVGSLSAGDLQVLRWSTGMIFQQFNLIGNRTVFENVAFPLRSVGKKGEEVGKRARELLDYVGLSDKADAYPAALSGGQKQRVAIARALANSAKILLCDEPTSALDPEMTRNVLELLQKVNRELGITIVIITHELDVAKAICSRVAVMDRGQVKEVGDIYRLFSAPQDSFTRDLVRFDHPCIIPEAVRKETEGRIFTIRYLEQTATSPLLSRAARKFQVDFNILHAQIDYIDGRPLGLLLVAVSGPADAVNEAVTYLEEKNGNLEIFEEAGS